MDDLLWTTTGTGGIARLAIAGQAPEIMRLSSPVYSMDQITYYSCSQGLSSRVDTTNKFCESN